MNKKIAVVIPIHKESITANEEKSLVKCQQVLVDYDIFLMFPDGLNIEGYLKICPKIIPICVPNNWLNSIESYNNTKRSLAFYNLFISYHYMLTYELDSYIFSDNWSSANCWNYDYIGAPWFEGFAISDKDSKIIGVGNSGFSIRNIKTCIKVLKEIEKIKKIKRLFSTVKLGRLFKYYLKYILITNKKKIETSIFIPLMTNSHINEDIFWGKIVPKAFQFKVASIQDSIRFSFENHPSRLFEMNEYNLPLGCHAWEKYEPDFWISYIK